MSDEYDPAWDLRGVVEDLGLLFAVAHSLADSEDWPNWTLGNEFRAARDRSADARGAGSEGATGRRVSAYGDGDI